MKKQVLTVFKFEFMNFIKQKKNWILVIIFLVLTAVLAFMPYLQQLFSGINDDSEENYFALVFDSSHISEKEESEILENFDDSFLVVTTFDDAVEQLNNLDIKGFYHLQDDTIKYYTKNSNINTYEHISSTGEILEEYFYKNLLLKNNIPVEDYEKLTSYIRGISLIEIDDSVSSIDENKDSSLTSVFRFFIAYVFIFLIYILVSSFGGYVVTTISQEKTGKTMEMLISSTSATSLIVGKFLAVFTSALIQIFIMLVSLIISLNYGVSMYSETSMPTETIASANSFDLNGDFYMQILDIITPVFVFYFIVLFFLSLAMYLLIYASLASFVSKIEDISSAIAVGTYSMLGAFLVSIFTLTNPEKAIYHILAYFPLFTPMAMFSRYSLGIATTFDMIYALVITSLTVVGLSILAGRLYKIGVLYYGTKPTIKKIFKSFVNKETM